MCKYAGWARSRDPAGGQAHLLVRVICQAQAARADVAHSWAAQHAHDLGGAASVVRDGQHVGHQRGQLSHCTCGRLRCRCAPPAACGELLHSSGTPATLLKAVPPLKTTREGGSWSPASWLPSVPRARTGLPGLEDLPEPLQPAATLLRL